LLAAASVESTSMALTVFVVLVVCIIQSDHCLLSWQQMKTLCTKGRQYSNCCKCMKVVRSDRIVKHGKFTACQSSPFIPLQNCQLCNALHAIAAFRGDTSLCPEVKDNSTAVLDKLRQDIALQLV
jgi:hypothetical protein